MILIVAIRALAGTIRLYAAIAADTVRASVQAAGAGMYDADDTAVKADLCWGRPHPYLCRRRGKTMTCFFKRYKTQLGLG